MPQDLDKLLDSLQVKLCDFFNSFIFTAVGVKCHVVTLRSLPIRHHSANYIFWSFEINEFVHSYTEYTVSQKDLLVGIKSGGMSNVPLAIAAHEAA